MIILASAVVRDSLSDAIGFCKLSSRIGFFNDMNEPRQRNERTRLIHRVITLDW